MMSEINNSAEQKDRTNKAKLLFEKKITEKKMEPEKPEKKITVTKRDGTKESLNLDKIHQVVEWACKGLSGVSYSDIEINANVQFFENIRTSDIHKLLIRSANDLISLKNINYQYVAARLLLFNIRKEVWLDTKPPSFYEFIKRRTKTGIYDKDILKKYGREEIKQIEKMIDHENDFKFTYAGLQQLADKYLMKDRKTDKLYETPQFMYMLISMGLFSNYDKKIRTEYVERFYKAISSFKINLPTPIMAGVRSPIKQYASCTLIDVGDSLNSIFNGSVTAVSHYTALRSGIGLNIGRLRGIGSSIRGGEVIHTGLIPYLKIFEATVKSCTQNGIRGGSATVYFPFWHQEVEDLIVLKNNKGNDENRVRKLDYGVQLTKLFYQRVTEDKDITLFSPHEVKDLYEAFGTEDFDTLYLKYEEQRGIYKKTINARKLFAKILSERIDTGRIYIMNIDHTNSHSSFTDKISLSNLCAEITLPTSPLESFDDENGEIALCILSALNLSAIEYEDIPECMELMVRSLNELIDLQDYPVKAAEISTKKRRSLGIGITSLAHWLAKNKLKYDDKEALPKVDELMEQIQYWGLKASVKIAMEKGTPCEWFDRTKYSKGILPIDTYYKNVDKLCNNPLKMDWDGLREEIKQHGLYNSTITAVMPCESSSITQNSTNGVEPPRAFMSVKKSKCGMLKQIVPDFKKLSQHYTLAYEMKNNTGYINIMAMIQKYVDQSISMNNYYDYERYENEELPLSEVMGDTIYAFSMGIKTLYYLNTNDGNKQNDFEEGCAGGSCSI